MTTDTNPTREALTRLESALADLRAHRADYHPKTFDLIEEPIVEEIERYRALLESQNPEQQSAPAPDNGADVAGNPALAPEKP